MTATIISIVEGSLVLAFILCRQLRVRPLAPNYRPALIVGGVGLVLAAEAVRSGTNVTVENLGAFLVGLVLATALAWPRARSMRVFRQGGRWMTRGTWVTVVWWLALLAGHVATVFLFAWFSGHTPHSPTGLDQDGLLVVLAVSLGLQAYVRGRRIPVSPMADDESGTADADARVLSR